MPDISGWEFLTLAAIAVVLFGPDRLPKLAADTARVIRAVRAYLATANADLRRELGPELADLRVCDLTPRGLVRRALGPDAGIIEELDAELRTAVDLRKHLDPAANATQPIRTLPPGQAAPFDRDAT